MSSFNVWGKTPVELCQIFEDLADESRNWDEPAQEETKTPSGVVLKRGAYQIEDFERMKAEMLEMKRDWEISKTSSTQIAEIKQPSTPISCLVCEVEGHTIEECPQLPVMKDTMMIYQQQNG